MHLRHLDTFSKEARRRTLSLVFPLDHFFFALPEPEDLLEVVFADLLSFFAGALGGYEREVSIETCQVKVVRGGRKRGGRVVEGEESGREGEKSSDSPSWMTSMPHRLTSAKVTREGRFGQGPHGEQHRIRPAAAAAVSLAYLKYQKTSSWTIPRPLSLARNKQGAGRS